MTPERLAELQNVQTDVLAEAARLLRLGGVLAYATCSVLQGENEGAVDRFVAQKPAWHIKDQHRRMPDATGDGFFPCIMLIR